jgi:hypothetical protein
MPTVQQNIEHVIEDRKRKLAEIKREVAYLEREISTLNGLLSATANVGATPSAPLNAAPGPSRHDNGGARRNGRRGLTTEWQTVMDNISAAGGASIAEIIEFAKAAGVTVPASSIRAQVTGYTKRNRLARDDTGRYTVIPA